MVTGAWRRLLGAATGACLALAAAQAAAQAPDLSVEGFKLSEDDRTLDPGQSFNLSAAVVNRGDGDSGTATLRYYRSADDTIDRSPVDMEVGEDFVREIRWSVAFNDEDLTSREDIQLQAPTPMTREHYWYYACVHPAVTGDNNGNNDCSDTERVLVGGDDPDMGSGPDLTVEGPSVSDTPLGPGQSFNFRVGVVNRGDRDSPATTLRYYLLSEDRTPVRTGANADREVGRDDVGALTASDWPSPVPPLAASAISRENIDLTAPETVGDYYLFACVDTVANEPEAETGNNCTTVGLLVQVQGAPDLELESLSVSDNSLSLGQAFTLGVTVFNNGTGGSAATRLRYYRSTDNVISPNRDVPVGTDEVGELAIVHDTPRNPSAESRQDIELNAPTSAGTYYYGACVDAVPGETDTNDNCSAGVRVVVSASPVDPLDASPDLWVLQDLTEVSDLTLNPGQSFNLRTAVMNGRPRVTTGHATATTLRYYRSEDAVIDRDPVDVLVGTDSVREIRWSQAFEEEDLTSREDIQLRAPGLEGIYHYYACVDAVPGEVNTANNCSPIETNDPDDPREVPELGVRILVGDDPDLAAEGPSASANVLGPGQTFEFRVGVVNRGDGDSPATVLRYYRSRDRNISGADTEVGTDDVPQLRASFPPSVWPQEVHESSQPGQSSLSRQQIELTAPTATGTYYYGACVSRVPGEADIRNDCSVGVRVEVRGAPDLRVEGFSVDDSRLLRGQSFNLSARVVNFGRGGSAATRLRFLRSEDALISATDRLVGTRDVPQLEAIHATSRNPSTETAVELREVPAPDEIGAYYYGACVEPPPGESRTDNNCSAGVRVLVSSGPDLVVEGLRLQGAAANDGKLFLGQSFRLIASVENQGDGDYTSSTLRFYRSNDAEVTTGGVQVGDPVNLTPSAATSLEISLEAAEPTGVRYYYACVDSVDGEVDSDNNCAALGVRVEVVRGPDLIVEALAVDDDSLAPGQSFILQASVVNDGDSAAARTTLRYYRSADDRISTRDAPLGTDPVPSLSIIDRGVPWDASRSRQGVHLQAPSTAGAYHYGACVDSVVRESNANNNCSAAVRVIVSRSNRAGDPDLALDASVSSSRLAPGGAFSLHVQVRNQGDEASGPTRLRYYRSANALISGDGDDAALGTQLVEGVPKSDGGQAGQALHSLQVVAPNAAGAYYYGACIDPVTGESDARNNCSEGVRVNVGEDADEEEDEEEAEAEEDGVDDQAEGMDEAANPPLRFWHGWRLTLLGKPEGAEAAP